MPFLTEHFAPWKVNDIDFDIKPVIFAEHKLYLAEKDSQVFIMFKTAKI